MSYILEALKKAEQKVQREELSGLITFSGEPVPEPKKRLIWPYFLIAAILLNVIVVAWFVVSRQTDKGAAAKQQVPAEQAMAVLPSEIKKEDSAQTDNAKKVMQIENINKPSVPISEERKREISNTATMETSAPKQFLSEPRQRTEKKPAPAASGKVLNLNELPSNIRSALPDFKISGHAYSPEPQTRVARVNDKILQEGQELNPGLKIEEIVQGGIIFSYQEYRFRINNNENR